MKITMKNFIAAAFLFSMFIVSGNLTTAQGSWKLKEIRVYNTMDGNYGTITAERYDASGGSVDIKISGNAAGACPGGFETVRFVWKFAGNITEVVNGGGVSASLAAGQSAKSQNCGNGLAADSDMEMRGSSSGGLGGYFSESAAASIDGDRFLTDSTGRARGAVYTQSGTGTVKVNTHNFNPKKPWAFFHIRLGTPTKYGGGHVHYIYLYENTGGNSGGGGEASSVSVEYDTDRMGGDYKDFDLPRADFELCRAACAQDGNCRAYTYVKPGGQGANARCWLKNGTPSPAGGLTCCISGVKSQGRSSLENNFLPDFFAYNPISLFQTGE